MVRLLGFLITVGICCSVTVGDEALPEPPVPRWIVDGAIVALDDAYPGVSRLALELLGDLDGPTLAIVDAEKIAAKLDDADPDVRKSALNALASMPEAAKPHVDKIVTKLDDPDRWVREAALHALAAMPEAAEPYVDKIAANFDVADPYVREAALAALAVMPEAAQRQAVAAIVAYFIDPDPDVRIAALDALAVIPEAVEPDVDNIFAMLDDGEWRVRRSALNALAAMPEAAKRRVDEIAANLDDSEEGVYRAALGALGAMPEAAEPHVDKIAAKLDTKGVGVRTAALEVLAAMPEAAKPHVDKIASQTVYYSYQHRSLCRTALNTLAAMPEAVLHHVEKIIACLDSSDADVREAALNALGTMSEDARRRATTAFAAELANWNRKAALKGLGAMPEAAKPHIDKIVATLDDSEADVREAALHALAAMPEAAEPHVEKIVGLLDDQGWTVTAAALEALAAIPEAAERHVNKIVALLDDQSWIVKEAALGALAEMPDVAKPHVDKIALALISSSSLVREAVLEAMPPAAKTQTAVPIAAKLDDPEPWVRTAALEILATMPKVATSYVGKIAMKLTDLDSKVRRKALEALAAMPDVAKPYVDKIVAKLGDRDFNVRRSALVALAEMPEAAKPYVENISTMLDDSSFEVQGAALSVLAAMPEAAAGQLGMIATKLDDWSAREAAFDFLAESTEDSGDFNVKLVESENSIRYAALKVILKIDKPEPRIAAMALNSLLDRPDRKAIAGFRFATHLVAGGDDRIELLLKHLGEASPPLAIEKVDGEAVFLACVGESGLWELASEHQLFVLRGELARIVANITIKTKGWQERQAGVLKSVAEDFRLAAKASESGPYLQSKLAIESVLRELRLWYILNIAANIWCWHVVFWAVLLTLYPWNNRISRTVQATFFWNPVVRKLFGVGYINFLLVHSPLRRILFAPFKPGLHQGTEYSDDEGEYFDGSTVKDADGNEMSLKRAADHLVGLNVLRGDSGLGKSMYMRHAVRNSKRLCVYITAAQCEIRPDHKTRMDGVVAAILSRLHGLPHDVAFLNTLLHVGVMDVYIDGVNEVGENTRSQIATFINSHRHTPTLLGMQRMAWAPPNGKLFELQPLSRNLTEKFLKDRAPILPDDAGVREDEYREACTSFLDSQDKKLDKLNDERERKAIRAILSNPMDLTTIAYFLGHGRQPDTLDLQQEQYARMAADFNVTHKQIFPLDAFSRQVFRDTAGADGRKIPLPVDEFRREVLCLEKHKMAYKRVDKNRDNKDVSEWWFRHEKVRDFFLARAFLTPGEPQPETYMADPRFRGVFFLLAHRLPVDAADELREALIDHAADTQDHSVMDGFVTHLRSRKAQVQRYLDELRSPLANIREAAATQLGKTGHGAERAIAALVEALKDDDSTVRKAAANALSVFGRLPAVGRGSPGP